MKARLVLLVALGLAVAVLFGPVGASADPSHDIQSPATLICSNGQTVVVNPGTVTNRSHQAFVISSDGSISTTSIYVTKYLAFTDPTGTFVIFDTAPGLTAQGLVECTADLGGGASLTAIGFFTPR
jgi:hypothetical protein